MKNNVKISLVLLAFVFVLGGCSEKNEIIRTFSGETTESGTEYALNIYDERVEIILESNITTGYDWVYEITSGESLEYKTDSYESGSSNLAGASGEHVFEFTVVSDGNSVIAFSYERSWEGESIEQIEFEISVAGGEAEVTAVNIG